MAALLTEDQASGLRRSARPLPPLVAIASGKGGVGKTFLAVNLALAWQRAGSKCALVDLDWGLGNVDVALGVATRRHSGHVLSGECTLEEALLHVDGLTVLPNGCGDALSAHVRAEATDRLLHGVWDATPGCNRLVVDTHPGLDPVGISLLRQAQVTLLVANPEPTALTDTYALFKTLCQAPLSGALGLVLNQTANQDQALETLDRLNRVSERFLGKTLECWGWIPGDPEVGRSVRRQAPLLSTPTTSRAAKAIQAVANTVTAILESRP